MAVNGLLVAGAGNMIKVFLDIEANTAESVNQLRSLKGNSPVVERLAPESSFGASTTGESTRSLLRRAQNQAADLSVMDLWKTGEGATLSPEAMDVVKKAIDLGYTIEREDGKEIRFISKGGSTSYCRFNYEIIRLGRHL